MKRIAVLFILMILSLSLIAGIAQADGKNSKIVVTSLVNQDPDPAMAGNVVELRLGVENIGGVAANNLVLEFVPKYPFSALAGEVYVKNVGTLNAYQDESDMKIVKFMVMVDKDATAGEYPLKIKEYEEGSSSYVTTTINVSIKSQESAEVIHIDKTTLVPGQETPLKFQINNVGNAPLRDLTFSWSNADKIVLPVGSDNTQYIKYIDVDQSAEMDYNVIADSNADAGLYQLDLQLSYTDPVTGTEKDIDTVAGIYVGGGTDFDIAFSESSSGTTSFTIANIGSNPAFSVSVNVPQQQGWRVTGSNSMIIGNLNTGDYTVASFALQSVQTGQTENSLEVQITYTDTMGKRETVEKEVSMNNNQAATTATTRFGTTGQTADSSASIANFRGRRVVQQQSFFSMYKWYILVATVLVVFGFSFFKYKKEKFLDPNFKFRNLFKPKTHFKKKRK